MKKTAPRRARSSPAAAAVDSLPGRVHPVVIYPFRPPDSYSDLEELYQLVARLNSEPSRYSRPVTVIDRKTHAARNDDRRYLGFREETVATHSDILDAWCVDTC